MELFKEWKRFRLESGSNVSFDTWCKDELIIARSKIEELEEEIQFLNRCIDRLK